MGLSKPERSSKVDCDVEPADLEVMPEYNFCARLKAKQQHCAF